ncbi:nuclear transport factor 2 family protein [Algoriphagus litoralis]|uniref:nuclear transport factor 2 family protein n=1 Tax=Algoriphagus litoralis TaxID=2202829 RepID=UPI000DB918EE|nr:nuclear transport factor 2 family protein [Algoriphagus litoralis]
MKVGFIVVFILVSSVSFAQQIEIDAITKTVHLYFDGMIQRDRRMLEEAFHPEARLIGYRGENFTITPFEAWANGTASGAPRNPADYQNSIKSIRVEGYTALVETELFWPGIYYYDFLTLIKVEEKWKIVHKTWYEKLR